MKKRKYITQNIVFPFVSTVLVCFLLGILVGQIPVTAIKENAQKSALFYQSSGLHPQESENAVHTRKDYYADTTLLNLICCQNEKHPLTSLILAPYFDHTSMDAAEDYMAVSFSRTEANTYYFRYWHGSMVWLKPLLCLMDIVGIFQLYKVLTIGFLMFIIIWCIARKRWEVGISFGLAFFIIGGWETVSCLEYGNTMLLVLGMTVVYLLAGEKNATNLFRLSVINGTLTCFIDFLTIETLVFTIPTGMWLLLQTGCDEDQCLKKQVITTAKALCCWFFSYVGMFVLKWVFAAGMIGIHGLFDSLQRTGAHMRWKQGQALFYNMRTMLHAMSFPDFVQMSMIIGYAIFLFYVAFELWKNKRMNEIILLMLPYLRYIAVSEHSYTHHYFTYRAQMISVVYIVLVILTKIKNQSGEERKCISVVLRKNKV